MDAEFQRVNEASEKARIELVEQWRAAFPGVPGTQRMVITPGVIWFKVVANDFTQSHLEQLNAAGKNKYELVVYTSGTWLVLPWNVE